MFAEPPKGNIRRSRPRFRLVGLSLSVFLFWIMLVASPASAHTGFVSSDPADGEVVDEPISEISLTFSAEAAPSGNGFVVLDPEENIRVPDELTSADNRTWILRFDDPLVGGVVGVRWEVAAPDAHPIEGSFSFTVSGPAPTTVPPTTVPPTTVPPTTVPPTPAQTGASTTVFANRDSAVLDDFLDSDSGGATRASLAGTLGRVLAFGGLVVAVGGSIFAAQVLGVDEGDLETVLIWVRRSGVLAAAGALVEGGSKVADMSGTWSGLWSGSALSDVLGASFGLAVGFRVLGGVLVAVSAGPRGTAKASLAADAGPGSLILVRAPVFVGTALLVMSYIFDGHTVSEGPRWLHALANVVHVTAAATWVGGVVMLALVITRRNRREADSDALELALRFSVVATFALISAAVAGIVLAVVVLDSYSDIWSTSWGRLLMAKLVLVAVAAAGGGYNRWIALPELERNHTEATVAQRFRTILTIEAALLLGVALVTAFLVAASTS